MSSPGGSWYPCAYSNPVFHSLLEPGVWRATVPANATGGDARRLETSSGLSVPRVLAVRSSDTFHGDDWIGVKMRDASVVRGIGVLPVFAGVLGLLLLVGSLAATWLREGR